MADDAHLVPGSFRPPAIWYREHFSTRVTPEGFRETFLTRQDLDHREIERAARGVINARKRTTGRKLRAMQLVDLYTVEHLPLPRLVLQALDSALDLGGYFDTIIRNREIAQLCGAGLSHKDIAAKFGISTKTVQRHQSPEPDPWLEATVALAGLEPMTSFNDLDHQYRKMRKRSRKVLADEETRQLALAPLLELARELTTKAQIANERSGEARLPVRRSIFKLVLWFAERERPLPRPVRWAVAVALGLGDTRRMSPYIFEKLWPSVGRQWQLAANERGEPVITNDDDGKPAFLSIEVEPEPRVGMRLHDRYIHSIELQAAERIKRGRPHDPALPLKNLAVDANVTVATMMAWAATDRWKAAVRSKAEYPIRNAIQLEAVAQLRGHKLAIDELANRINIEPSTVETWRTIDDYQARIAALVKKMRAAERVRAERMQEQLTARGTGPSQ